MIENPQPRFWELVAEAQAASEEVNDFNVDSSVPDSKAAFEKLCAAQDAAAYDLVTFVIQSRGALVKAFQP